MLKTTLVAFLLAIPAAAGATNYWVGPGGSNQNTGTSPGSSFQTIQRGADLAQPGDTVFVLAGDYDGFTVKRSGTSDTQRIVFKSVVKLGAVLSVTPYRSTDVVSVSHDYITIDGFYLKEGRRGIGMFSTIGLLVRNCYITDCNHGAQGPQNSRATYEYNTFEGNGGQSGYHALYFGGGDCPNPSPPMTGLVVRHNVFKNHLPNSGSTLHFVSHRPGYKHEAIIEGNTFAWNSDRDITGLSIRNTYIRNNVIYSNYTGQGAIEISSVSNYCATGTMDSADSVRVYNNTIFVPNNKGIYLRDIPAFTQFDGEGFVIFNNVIIASSANNAIVNDSMHPQSIGDNVIHGMNEANINTTLNNLFWDYANDDFRIKEGSEAHNAGAPGRDNIEAPAEDMEGSLRPQGGTYDAGAYEVIEDPDASPPSPPQQVNATETSPGCATVTWRANSEPDIAGYVVYYGPQSVPSGAGSYAQSQDVGNVTSAQVCSLPAGTQYFAVKAYDGSGTFSGYSLEHSLTIQGPDAVAPSVVLLNPGDGAANVPLTSLVRFSLTDAGAGVDTNSVNVSIDGNAPAWIAYSGSPARFDVTCGPSAPFAASANVPVVVSASDLASTPNTGGRTWSFTTEAAPASPPAIPSGVTAQETNPGCATVAWQTNSEPDLAGYVIYYGTLSVAQGTAASYTDSIDVGTQTAREICSLEPGLHYFAVKAYDSDSEFSGYSTEQTVNIAGPDAVAPNVVLLNPGDGASDVLTGSLVRFSLADGGAGVDTNTVDVAIDGNAPEWITYSGNPTRFDVRCQPSAPFANSATVTVTVTVSDLAPTPNAGGRTWSFTTAAAPPTPPAIPSGVSAQETNPGCVTVAWQANAESDLAGYMIYHGVQSVAQGAAASYTDSIDVGTQTARELCSLPAGTRYFAVKAYDADSEYSAYSTEQTVNVTGPDTTPPGVGNLNPGSGAVDVGLTSLVHFSLADAGAGVDTNSVDVSIGGSAAAWVAYSGNPGRYSVTCAPAAPFDPSATVTVTVSVSDLAPTPNVGGRSWNFTTAAAPPSPPAVPSGVTAQETNPGCVTVAWQANSEPDLAGYRVYHGAQSVAQGGATSYADSIDVGTQTAREVCSLPPGTRYFAVRAYDVDSEYSGYSTEQTVIVTGPDVDAPRVLVVSPGRGATGVSPSADIHFAILDDGNGVDTNTVSVLINGAAPSTTRFTGDPSSIVVHCAVAGGLPPSSSVAVVVNASDYTVPPNSVTDGWSFTTGSVAPAAPTGLSAQGTTSGEANLSWTANTEPNLEGYVIYFGTESVAFGAATSYRDSIPVDAATTSFPVGGLADGRFYFALRARNIDGVMSSYSGEVFADVTNGSTQGPLPPQALQVTETSAGCMTISWHASSEPDVVGYMIHYGSQSVARGETAIYSVSRDVRNATAEEICNLQSSMYYVAVRAYNASGAYSAFSTEKSVNVVNADVQAPSASLVYPAANASNVPPNTKVFLLFSDSYSGVDTASVSVLINNQSPAHISYSGDSKNRAAVCDLAWPLPPNSSISVDVIVSDMATPTNVAARSWSFTTGSAPDGTPPVFDFNEPPNLAANVDPRTRIYVVASDDVGLDPSRAALYVNGQTTAASVTTGTGGQMTIERTAHGGLPDGTVQVLAVVYDLAGNRAELAYEFTTGTVTASSSIQTEIVPDGYWADDPSRPLEVRNIPMGWTVRIFDASGAEVRSYRNGTADGLTWTWDFANDHGRPVARAIYLVRVIDDRGAVKQSGKFLVRNNQ